MKRKDSYVIVASKLSETLISRYLSNIRLPQAEYGCSQRESVRWLQHALHTVRKTHSDEIDERDFELAQKFYERLSKSDAIGSRRSCLRDFTLTDYEIRELFTPGRCHDWFSPSLEERMAIFSRTADRVVAELDLDLCDADYLMQVSCTGYESPNAIQKLISRSAKRRQPRLLHIGHMGCYASLPALQLAAEMNANKKVALFFAELCSLHVRPEATDLATLVAQTLFADGFAYFEVGSETPGLGFELLDYHEEVLPESTNLMTWNLTSGGFLMFLDGKIPGMIRKNLNEVTAKFLKPLELSISDVDHWAIHPGGPRVIESVVESLSIDDAKACFSKDVLREFGNMSSATIPHIWEQILHCEQVNHGDLVASVAFGPGLTVALNTMRVIKA